MDKGTKRKTAQTSKLPPVKRPRNAGDTATAEGHSSDENNPNQCIADMQVQIAQLISKMDELAKEKREKDSRTWCDHLMDRFPTGGPPSDSIMCIALVEQAFTADAFINPALTTFTEEDSKETYRSLKKQIKVPEVKGVFWDIMKKKEFKDEMISYKASQEAMENMARILNALHAHMEDDVNFPLERVLVIAKMEWLKISLQSANIVRKAAGIQVESCKERVSLLLQEDDQRLKDKLELDVREIAASNAKKSSTPFFPGRGRGGQGRGRGRRGCGQESRDPK